LTDLEGINTEQSDFPVADPKGIAIRQDGGPAHLDLVGAPMSKRAYSDCR